MSRNLRRLLALASCACLLGGAVLGGAACEGAEETTDDDGPSGCPKDTTRCSGACVDTRSSDAHCGGCGIACASDEACRDATCVYKPEPNGTKTSEADACDKVQAAYKSKALTLNCAATVRTCPQFLRVHYDPDCMQYDAGSVEGCVAFFKQILKCTDLVETACLLTAYPETAPAGCP
jgi:hypothetical protein